MRLTREVGEWRRRGSGRRTAGRTLEGLLGSGSRRWGVVPRRCGARHQVSRPRGLDAGALIQKFVESGRHGDAELPVVSLALAASAALSLQGPGEAHCVVAGLGHSLDQFVPAPPIMAVSAGDPESR